MPTHSLALRLALVAALPLAAACNADAVRFPAPNGPMAAQPTYTLQQVSVSHQVRFAPGSSQLSQTELVGLRDFLMSAGPQMDEVALVSATGPGAAARGQAVVEQLRRHSIYGAVQIADGPTDNTVSVSFDRRAYLPAACMQADNYRSNNDLGMPPLGCANAINLARMVEDPNDLVRPRPLGAAEAAPAAVAVGAYRAGETPDLGSEGAP